MGAEKHINDDETKPLTGGNDEFDDSRTSIDSSSTASISLALANNLTPKARRGESSYAAGASKDVESDPYRDDEERDFQDGEYIQSQPKPVQRKAKIIFWILFLLCLGGWSVAFVLFLFSSNTENAGTSVSEPQETTASIGDKAGKKKITLDQVMRGEWSPRAHSISWIPGPNGEDGLLLEQERWAGEAGYLRVEDIKSRAQGKRSQNATVLMQKPDFVVGKTLVSPAKVWPSPDWKTVLVMSDEEKNWRHSFTGKYWLFDVESQTGQALDPDLPDGRIQLASWSPKSDAVVFTRDNNMFMRKLSSEGVEQITTDGGTELFYGVPDWVYEEEVYEGNSVTWWSAEGQYVAFLRTNESIVPEYPVQYFLSRPSGTDPAPGEENYPDVRNIKYPKAGAPNPIVNLMFYDVAKKDVFSIDVPDEFPDDDRLIIEVIWASGGKVLVRETNRESDVLNLALIDASTRTGKIVRTIDIDSLDGGWVEPSQSTRFIPADPSNERLEDGYIETVISEGRDHLAYFTPLDNPKPIILTSGDFEVVDAPSAVDLRRGLVYFVAAKDKPWDRHVFSVRFDGSDFRPVTNASESAYYSISFSHGAGYALLDYQGPNVPWQKVISTPSNVEKYEDIIEKNDALSKKVGQYGLPSQIYQEVSVDGFSLPVVERRPPNFDPKKKYPVLFHLYGGPGSQTVSKQFKVNFQSYVAAALGYIVVTVDGRGTGYIGRKARCIIRGNIGHYEARDQIETAKIWAQKRYVDESRIAIWGWSYGGFMTLKTLEQDAGETFQYGMAVAPVTDWRFYDSIYTERYMRTPQHNGGGYQSSAISNTTALAGNVRFLVMHGSADDNVHFQNTLTLLDKLDLDGVDNYDVHVFPDSDHSIYFHNANPMVYGRLSDWLINAFNGEWLKTHKPTPNGLLRRALALLVRS